MRALIVLAHPEPASFNGGMKDVAVTTLTGLGHGVEVSDLYAMAFDPVEGPGRYPVRRDPDCFTAQTEQRHAWETGTLSPDVAAEIDKLERADLLIFQYPMWWYGTPGTARPRYSRDGSTGCWSTAASTPARCAMTRAISPAGAPCFR